jgi:hypothetical protein
MFGRRPGLEALLGQLIDQGQQPGQLFPQQRAGALPATVLVRQGTEAAPLVGGHGIEAMLARFAAGQDPGWVKFAPAATTGRFTTLAPQEVEGALHHGSIALKRAQGASGRAVEAPEFLAKPRDGLAHDCITYITRNTDCKRKIAWNNKK